MEALADYGSSDEEVEQEPTPRNTADLTPPVTTIALPPAPNLLLPEPEAHFAAGQSQTVGPWPKRAHPSTAPQLPLTAASSATKKQKVTTRFPLSAAPGRGDSLLIPPQLRGRANIATEDLSSIFSRRRQP